MSAVFSALSTLALEGYSISIPDWVGEYFVIFGFLFCCLYAFRIIKCCIVAVKERKDD